MERVKKTLAERCKHHDTPSDDDDDDDDAVLAHL